jgi:hypothetical protein
MTDIRDAYLEAGISSCSTTGFQNVGHWTTSCFQRQVEILVENLYCLCINAGDSNALKIIRGTPDGYNDAEFIAVSYSWTAIAMGVLELVNLI